MLLNVQCRESGAGKIGPPGRADCRHFLSAFIVQNPKAFRTLRLSKEKTAAYKFVSDFSTSKFMATHLTLFPITVYNSKYGAQLRSFQHFDPEGHRNAFGDGLGGIGGINLVAPFNWLRGGSEGFVEVVADGQEL